MVTIFLMYITIVCVCVCITIKRKSVCEPPKSILLITSCKPLSLGLLAENQVQVTVLHSLAGLTWASCFPSLRLVFLLCGVRDEMFSAVLWFGIGKTLY